LSLFLFFSFSLFLFFSFSLFLFFSFSLFLFFSFSLFLFPISLSHSFDRYFRSDTGVAAAKWLQKEYATIAANRPDITVVNFTTTTFPQASVIATIPGSGPNKADVCNGLMEMGWDGGWMDGDVMEDGWGCLPP
jgi:hypothetical protein